ncbi:MAG: cytidine/deoxycytidylate deaminase family protein [Vampirovibrionia bacterium]
MKETNYSNNLVKISEKFTNTDNLSIEKYIPDYFKQELYLPTEQVNFDLAVTNIENKLQRDWKYHSSFMKIVDVVSELGTCERRKVGAVLVRNRRILATGFNGTPPGSPHCNDEICPGRHAPSGSSLSLCAAVHAEMNCLVYCARYGVSASDATLYVSCEPCDDCMKLIETVGINYVFFNLPYPTKMSALRKYFKAKCISMSDLAKEYTEFCQNRINFTNI